MKDIPNFDSFVKVEPIHKGWSSDKKYYVETKNNKRLLLRVSDILEYKAKQQEFDIMKKMSSIGMKMSLPVSFGICENGKSMHQLLTWCDRPISCHDWSRSKRNVQYSFCHRTDRWIFW